MCGRASTPSGWQTPRDANEGNTMDLQLRDKVVFVAGASRGIGLGIVEALLAEGARLAITARRAEALEATRARLASRYGADPLWAPARDTPQPAVVPAAPRPSGAP